MKKFKKGLMMVMMVVALVAMALPMSSFAAVTLEDGTYTATVNAMNASDPNAASMMNGLVNHTATIVVSGGEAVATVTLQPGYVMGQSVSGNNVTAVNTQDDTAAYVPVTNEVRDTGAGTYTFDFNIYDLDDGVGPFDTNGQVSVNISGHIMNAPMVFRFTNVE